jgi:ATP-dependent RNA helicase RhlE
MGFLRDIKKILAVLPRQRQNLLFSATFSDDIRDLARGLVNNPVEISVSTRNTTAENVEQLVYPVDKKKKAGLLIKLIKDNEWQQVLVFMKTKHGANKLTKQLEAEGIRAAAIHGNKSQGARTKALANFKCGDVNVLVATDIAARGIDIDQLPQVVNFELPNVPEDYVHRIGRTGRAGASGKAVSLVSSDEIDYLNDVQQLIQQHIPREIVEGFTPYNAVPDSRQLRPVKKKPVKKPRQSKIEHHDGQRSAENARGHKPQSKNPRHRNDTATNNDSNGAGRRKKPPQKTKNAGNDPYSATR